MSLKVISATNRRDIRHHVAIGLALIVSITLVAALIIVNSEAYVVAKRFALGNAVVKANVGEPIKARLGLGSLGYRFSGPFSETHFLLVIKGPSGNGNIRFKMTKRDEIGPWDIDDATFESASIKVSLLERKYKNK